jgi:hypothetical protein
MRERRGGLQGRGETAVRGGGGWRLRRERIGTGRQRSGEYFAGRSSLYTAVDERVGPCVSI